METALLIVHYLSFVIGAGGSFIAFMIVRRIASRPTEEAAVLRQIPPMISNFAVAGLVLLWVTGVALVYWRYGGFAGLGWAFSVKMVFVVALTAVVAAMRFEMRRARQGIAAAGANLARLSPWPVVTSWLAIVFAVIAFG
jgi:uncharacterized membrane protein